MSDSAWDPSAVPDLGGRLAVVTGANSGLGLESAVLLARHGATVVLACRSAERGETGRTALVRRVPDAAERVRVRALDVADLASVASFAARLGDETDRVDLLLNNAGVMAVPRRTTADGFELQLGTNHLGHFALTAHLWPLLVAAGEQGVTAARVVTVSSEAHRMGRIDRQDLLWERRYQRWGAYCRSKLANLLFTFELDRRLQDTDLPVRATAAHPGISGTDLFADMLPGVLGRAFVVANRLVTSSPTVACWPLVRAATDPDVGSGDFLGPHGLGRFASGAVRQQPDAHALDADDGGWLWEESAKLTGVDPGFVTASTE